MEDEKTMATSDTTIDGVTPGQQTMDFEAAKKWAAEHDLPILLNFSGSDWCDWCGLMHQEVFSNPAWASFAESNLVMVLVDFPEDETLIPEKYVARNEELRQRFDVEGFPTFLLLDDDGETELGRRGAGEEETPETFAAAIRELTRYRDVNVGTYLKDVEPEEASVYRKIVEEMRRARRELSAQQTIIAQAEERIEELVVEIVEAEDAARDFRAGRLDQDQRTRYEKLKADHSAAETALVEWLETDPEETPENTDAFEALSGRIEELDEELLRF